MCKSDFGTLVVSVDAYEKMGVSERYLSAAEASQSMGLERSI